MCGTLTVAIALCFALLIPTGALAWVAFLDSVKQHRAAAGVIPAGLRDDAGMTAFERQHLRQVIANDFDERSDSKLRALAAKARMRLLVSAGIGVGLVLLLLARTSNYCAN